MKTIFTSLLIFISLSLFSQEKRIALVIGNAEYTKGALKNPVNDAKLIAKTLDSLGFEILEYYNLKSQREFKNAIRKFGVKRDSADVGFVYYAGHGVQIKNENYKEFALMCDDYNLALTYVKDEDLKTAILDKISKNCEK